MNKFLATLLAGAFALSLGTAAFAADTAKAAEPVKMEASASTVDSTAKAEPEKVMKKHQHKHAKKAAAPAVEMAPVAPAGT
jgi:hypothetical protein